LPREIIRFFDLGPSLRLIDSAESFVGSALLWFVADFALISQVVDFADWADDAAVSCGVVLDLGVWMWKHFRRWAVIQKSAV